MTKLCIHSNSEKECNDSDHVIHYDDNFTLSLRKSFFKTPDAKGRNFFVKFLNFRPKATEKKKLVMKWSRHKQLRTPKYKFKNAMKRSNRTSRIIAAFKDSFDTLGWKFTVVMPTVVRRCRNIGVTVEPYIDNLICFEEYVNSDKRNGRVVNLLNAMTHFSYKFSGGNYVVQNLKIAVDEDRKCVIMLPPALVSCTKGSFGLEDNGTLDDFFRSEHTCNEVCRGISVPM